MIFCIYVLDVVMCVAALPVLIFSIISKRREACKALLLVSALYIPYLFADIYVLPSELRLPVGLDVLLLYLVSAAAGVLYLISVIICAVKLWKRKTEDKQGAAKYKICAAAALVLPVLLVSAVFFGEYSTVQTADAIVVCYSAGNGGFDGTSFAYAVNDKYCTAFDIGVDFFGYDIERFLPKNAVKADAPDSMGEYSISVDEDGIEVYKNGSLLHSKPHRGNYFNIEVKKCYYTKAE